MERTLLGKRSASNSGDQKSAMEFKKGQKIEIQSGNVWLPATIERLKKGGERAVVGLEYDDTAKTTVNLENIRPAPPYEPGRKFKNHQIVDVFHKVGWHEGIVLSLKGSCYLVYTRYSGDQIEVAERNLRQHREWIHGDDWQPPFKKEEKVRLSLGTEEVSFRNGQNVEFMIGKRRFQDAWFSGQLIRSQGILNVETCASPLIDIAGEKVVKLRLVPPSEVNRGFKINSVVEVWVDGVWRKAIVVSVPIERDAYCVYFPKLKKESEFNGADLRLHREWTDGEWVPPSPEPEVFILSHSNPALYRATGQTPSLCTKSLVPGKSVYGEKRLVFEGEEYRVWNPRISKISAVLSLDVDLSWLAPGMRLLYLGAGTGRSVSHIADILGARGRVYAVDITRRGVGTRTLESRVASRNSIVPIIADAREPSAYGARVRRSPVDAICTDLEDPDELLLLVNNVERFLKLDGHFLTFVKDVGMAAKEEYLTKNHLHCEKPVPLGAFAPGYVALHGIFCHHLDR